MPIALGEFHLKMATKTFSWYWNRLRAMDTKEILIRSMLAVRKKIWRRRRNWIAPDPIISNKDVWSPGIPFEDVGHEKVLVLAEVEKYIDHNFTLLNVNFADENINWHLDPETNVCSPATFAFDIDYRNRDIAGNVKNIWELNRHHHLTLLAVAYALTHKPFYAEEIHHQLESWVIANPVPLGVNWYSSLEMSTRLISWVWIERLIRETSQHEKLFGSNGILWPSIYWHQWFIYNLRSYGSSSNNHLVGELVGLFVSATVWPFYEESSHWVKVARQGLEKEVSRQTFPSGLNREMAFSYHIYSSELFLLAELEAKRFNIPFSSRYTKWTKRMTEVIPQLIDVGGNIPRFGDEDGGRSVHLRPFTSSRLEWLYWLGANLNKACIPKIEGDMSLVAATVGLPKDVPVGASHLCEKTGSFAIEDAGLYVLARNRGTKNEIFSIVDAGPLGFLSIAAHGHADALAFTMSVGGIPIIVDAGTYSYFMDQEERDYFRGTKAHNTVSIDNTDQSVSRGAFMWKQKANARVIFWKSTKAATELCAEHDGYRRLSGNIIHRRNYLLTDSLLNIDDNIQGEGKHYLEWRLQFHPNQKVKLEHGNCHVGWDNGSLEIKLDPKLQWKLLYGDKEGGWYSPEFNLKVPATMLVGQTRTSLPLSLKHTIKILCVD
jgi:hypothetical protein